MLFRLDDVDVRSFRLCAEKARGEFNTVLW